MIAAIDIDYVAGGAGAHVGQEVNGGVADGFQSRIRPERRVDFGGATGFADFASRSAKQRERG